MTLHVIVQHDALDYVLTASTVFATGFAAWAILAARSARGALVTERRLDFELVTLRELADYYERIDTGTQGLVVTRLRMLPLDDFPWLADTMGLRVNEAVQAERRKLQALGSAQYNSIAKGTERDAIRAEIDAAITKRLASRG